MEWIVHIGTEKTGSKAIQGFLANEPHRITGRTFCFPRSGRGFCFCFSYIFFFFFKTNKSRGAKKRK